MSEVAIRVEGLGKQYRIGARELTKSLRETLSDAVATPFRRLRNGNSNHGGYELFWALKDVSFEVKRGEVVGIIGRNGAGKSTLLKILSRITDPTEGYAEIHGRVGSLLEVGTGFHPQLTGRENIFLNGAILGMKKAEIVRKFDEIVAFAEVEKFIDTPVRFYSSGMYVRLAFAVAAHLEPEVLIVDEVLAVGDVGFQRKCLGKMGDVASQGRTILFVSHNMPAILDLCERSFLLETGNISTDGESRPVVQQYLQQVRTLESKPLRHRTDRQGDQSLTFTGFEIRDEQGVPVSVLHPAQNVSLAFTYESRQAKPLRNVSVAIGLHGSLDESIAHLSTKSCAADFDSIPSLGTIQCNVPSLPLVPGEYSFNLFCTVSGHTADWVQNAGQLRVCNGGSIRHLPPPGQGLFLVPHSWQALPL